MEWKKTFFICILFMLIMITQADAQKENRRRGGRRRPITESPVQPLEEPESEMNQPKFDISEPEKIPKSKNVPDPEMHAPKQQSNSGGPPSIVPRGTRKPRPLRMRNDKDNKTRPTLPAFARKNNGRGFKSEKLDSKKMMPNHTSSASVTKKPSRNSSRRGNQHNDSNHADKKHSNSTTDTTPKKRFGSGGRRHSRGGRKSTVAPNVENAREEIV